MFRTIAFALLLVVSSLSAIAQIENGFFPEFNEKDQARFRIIVPSTLRAMFDGGDRSGALITLLTEMPVFPVFKEEFGITPEQRSQFNNAVNKPELMPEELRALVEKPMKYIANIDEYLDYVLTEEEEAELDMAYNAGFEYMNMRAAETYTEEQMQRLNNVVFGITGGLQSPFLNERHMDTLEMTDEQKEQFKKINEETKPERDKMVASFDADLQKMIKTGKMSVNDFFRAMSKFQTLGSTLKKRRSEVLTSSQLAKAREMARLPKSMTFSVFDVLPKWQPGPNSWKPGDPLPEGIVPPAPRRGNFPRTENPSP
jgi:Spy/CpxP family protein refolding chaperone